MIGVSRKKISNYSPTVGYGYITIPSDVDREIYIKDCLKKERISIQLDNGGSVVHNCYADKGTLQLIKFPKSYKELGSCVAFVTPEFSNIPIVVSVLSKTNESQLLEENSFKKVVYSDNASVSVEGKGNSGELFINVNSEFEDEGSIYITLRSKNNTAKFNVNCFGDINLYSEGKVNLRSLNQIDLYSYRIENGDVKQNALLNLSDSGFTLTDGKDNVLYSDINGNINIIPKDKLLVFEGKHPLVKGDELKSQLEKSKDRIDKILNALNSAVGATVVDWSASLRLLLATIIETEDYDNINSEKSFTD